MSIIKERQTLLDHIRLEVNPNESPHAWIKDLLQIARTRWQASVASELVRPLLVRKGRVAGGHFKPGAKF